MPKPAPAPENKKVRRTVSLTHKVSKLADAYIHREGETEHLNDFSDLVSRAIVAYAQQKHPTLYKEIVQRIRDAAAARDKAQMDPLELAIEGRLQEDAWDRRMNSGPFDLNEDPGAMPGPNHGPNTTANPADAVKAAISKKAARGKKRRSPS